MDRGRRRLALHGPRLSHRPGARICLRPGGRPSRLKGRNLLQGADGRSQRQGLDHRRHEERLEDDLPCGEGDSLRRKCPAHGRASAQADRAILSYFFVQLPNNANDEGASEIPPVNDPFSSEMVAFQVFLPCVPLRQMFLSSELRPSISSVSPFSPMAASVNCFLSTSTMMNSERLMASVDTLLQPFTASHS